VIKTIIFDYGGVILKTPDHRWLNRWKTLLGMDHNPDILEMIENPHESQLIRDVCLGKIPEHEIWQLIAEKWQLKPQWIEDFRHQESSKRNLNQQTIKLMKDLNRKYHTAILSNAGDQTREIMENSFQLHHLVDEIIISAEEGVIKPDPEIYQIALDRLKAAPESSLFVDDYLPNVTAARALGMHAVQFINTAQAVQMIQFHLNERH
jgi:putative hydrolase of the HAD superfamily